MKPKECKRKEVIRVDVIEIEYTHDTYKNQQRVWKD